MYQSIPKRVYTTKESAMPKFPSEMGMYTQQKEQIPVRFQAEQCKKKESAFFKNLETDDLLLIGLLLLLLTEDGDNQLLIAVVAFLLFF